MTFDNIDAAIEAVKAFQKVPDWVQKAREYHKTMKQLVYGDEVKDLILQIEHIETSKRANARKKYARSIKDVNAKILEPVSNVFSATGGTKNYNIDNETAKERLMAGITNVKNGKSIEGWMNQYFAKDIYVVDPSGLMFLEYESDKAYITYKSIDCIRYYKEKGQNIEYVIFEPKKRKTEAGEEQVWRVVDDKNDFEIIQRGGTFLEDDSFTHDFGYCPGRINSEKKQFGKDWRLSPLDVIIDAEKEFLRDRSILTMYKFLNGFSTPYMPKIICPTCHGTGKNGIESCPDCTGKGHILSKDVTDEIIIPIDLNAENPISLPTNFAGFISPDLEIWNQYRDEQRVIFNEMFESIWGTREANEVKDQTAMGAYLNVQPMISKLNEWSTVVESHESFFTELLANFHMPGKKKEERISLIAYGRNYIVQPPEYMLSEYQKSKEAGDPVLIMDKKLVEYLTSKYKNDPETLRIELLKKKLEPYVHMTIEAVNTIFGRNEAMKKGLFTDWWETLYQSDLMKPKDELEADMNKWFDEKIAGFVPVENPINTNQN